MKKLLLLGAAIALVAAACGDSGSDSDSEAPSETPTTVTETTEAMEDETGDEMDDAVHEGSAVSADAQVSIGTSIVASAELSAPGFIVIHSDVDGAPGPVIGNSELLPVGASEDVVIELSEFLLESSTVWPMAHLDDNENGEYDFNPPDDLTDAPASDADGNVAVVATEIEYLPTSPATVTGEAQSSSGSTVVASAELPTAGFIAIHADLDGAPGPVIGSSELLPAGSSTDVVIQLDTPLEESTTVWPMVHVDANANGEYEFMPPDVVVDGPAFTADGNVAVAPIEVEFVPAAPASISGEDQDSDGTTIVASVELPAPGFIAIHADLDGAPGPVIGNSELLPAGESVDVVIELDTPLDGSTTVWPMAHVDGNANGEYDFSPPDVIADGPAFTADGDVAVGPLEITLQ
jgi:S-layer glycoprotein